MMMVRQLRKAAENSQYSNCNKLILDFEYFVDLDFILLTHTSN